VINGGPNQLQFILLEGVPFFVGLFVFTAAECWGGGGFLFFIFTFLKQPEGDQVIIQYGGSLNQQSINSLPARVQTVASHCMEQWVKALLSVTSNVCTSNHGCQPVNYYPYCVSARSYIKPIERLWSIHLKLLQLLIAIILAELPPVREVLYSHLHGGIGHAD
jgi:hypothetical protein